MANDYVALVFVHGWSVTNLNTYGQLPIRLREEGKKANVDIAIVDIFLGQYISFHDEVRLPDISRAFQTAVNDKLGESIKNGKRFIAITHSTGGPVIRDWSIRYKSLWPVFPMSHLIMLAPANFGSALAQLGKGRISRLNSWFEGVEPGQGVLDWLELGSNESWKLNKDWIKSGPDRINEDSFFPFVLIGQYIDRKLYDNLNSYTGELGSDGVVRSAAANLNATYVLLKQQLQDNSGYQIKESSSAPETAFRIVRHSSHSGAKMGIMAGEKEDVNDINGKDTVDAIISCIKITNREQYDKLCVEFANETAKVQVEERREDVPKGLLSLKDRYFIHDRFSMVIFKVYDEEGYPVTDYDLIFTAGSDDNANHLPEGFFKDRQKNSKSAETITYYINYDIMNPSPPVMDGEKIVRDATEGVSDFGLEVTPRPDKGFVSYKPFKLKADKNFLGKVINPNATTLIEICLQRLVDKNVFVLSDPIDTMPTKNTDFSGIEPSKYNVA